ncbi:WD40 repeat domain-containing protein [Candidatus Magnetominusculus dajiuhuensis]|uniref:WD40 repeat domain-containing protein n=1 Tax=Candidatus Magnetominusculus dajiuhuensis TaxID=3137712 RepID=UPI003B433506
MLRWGSFVKLSLVLFVFLALLAPTASHADNGWAWNSTGSNAKWYSVASNSDGTRLIAAIKGGDIWSYSNGAWTEAKVNGDNNTWTAVASDSTGTKLVAAASGGDIWTYSNGVWAANKVNGGSNSWAAVASNSDGTKLVAAVNGGDIWTYSNGVWTGNNAGGGSNSWAAVASNSDGTKLVAAVNGGDIWTYSNGIWTPNQVLGGSSDWAAVASNSDGTKLAAVNSTGVWVYSNGLWTASLLGQTGWSSVASSADGSRLAAASYGGDIWTYVNGTWTAGNVYGGGNNWNSIASDSTGTKLVAVISSTHGSIWTGYYSVNYPAASAWINALCSEYSAYYGTKAGGVVTLITTSGAYFMQYFNNGKIILAWTDGYLYSFSDTSWNSLFIVWNGTSVADTANAWINGVYSVYPSLFGTKSGGVTAGTDANGTYYIQLFTNGTAILAYSDGYLYYGYGGVWHSFGIKWE